MKKPVDEWGRIIEKQAEINQFREHEERMRQQRERSQYKESLQYQQYLKQLQRDKEIQERNVDFNDVQQKVNTFNYQENLKRQQEAALKQHLASEWKQHQQLLQQRAAEERQRLQREEQERLDRLRRQQEEDERRRQEFRSGACLVIEE